MRALTTAPETDAASRHDRQIRAFGAAGQRRLRQLTVAVVGVGGAGSLLVQGLAHLGVGRLVLVDPDVVDHTNLNRVVGARPKHAKRRASKVSVAAALARHIDSKIAVHAVQGDVLDPDTWQLLRCADILLGALDAHAPRWALNALAVQYARCYIDVGVEITTRNDGTLDVAGHVATVTPDGPCLLCLAGYDSHQVAAEVDTPLAEAKRRAGYLTDAPDEPAPAVIFLNQAVTAVALGEVVNQVTCWRPTQPYVLVDLSTPATTVLQGQRVVTCPACGSDSPRGLGDAGGVAVSRSPLQPPAGGELDGTDNSAS